MVITVNPETEQMIAEQLRLGSFNSPDELVQVALTEWFAFRLDTSLDADELMAIEEADAEFDRGATMDFEAFKAELAKRIAES